MTHTASNANDLPTLTVVQFSDVHLKRDTPDRRKRFEDIIQLALKHQPDVIVLSGDLTDDGFIHPEDLAWGKNILNSLISQEVLLIPGNHDVGNKPGQGPNAITAQRLAHWLANVGSDHFVKEIGNWRLIGINSLLIGSNLLEEDKQLKWLDQMLDEAKQLGELVAVFMHEPAFLKTPGVGTDDRSDYWPIAADKQELYMQQFKRKGVKLVASGHVHAYRSMQRDGVSHVWCPSPAFIIHDQHFDPQGEVAGFIVHTLTPHGATHKLIRYDRPNTKVIPFNPATTSPP